MSIEFGCGKCGSRLKAPDNSAGKRVKCPKCETIQTIPAPADDLGLMPLPSSPPSKLSTTTPSKPSAVMPRPATAQPKPVKAPQPAPLPSSSPLASLDNFLEDELTAGPPVKVEKPAWEIPTPAPESSSLRYGYAPGSASTESPRRGRSSGMMAQLKIPAIMMMLLSGLMIVVLILNCCNVVLKAMDSKTHDGSYLFGYISGAILMTLFLVIVNGAIYRGALCMMSGTNYSTARTGAIWSAIPICGVLSFPFGIWALILLSTESVKRSFDG